MSDRQMLMSSGIDGKYGIVLQDKVLFELVMSRYVKVPQNFALIRDGKVIWLDGRPEEGRVLIGLIRQQEKLIFTTHHKYNYEVAESLPVTFPFFFYFFNSLNRATTSVNIIYPTLL